MVLNNKIATDYLQIYCNDGCILVYILSDYFCSTYPAYLSCYRWWSNVAFIFPFDENTFYLFEHIFVGFFVVFALQILLNYLYAIEAKCSSTLCFFWTATLQLEVHCCRHYSCKRDNLCLNIDRVTVLQFHS